MQEVISRVHGKTSAILTFMWFFSPLRGVNLLPSPLKEKKLTQVTKMQMWGLCRIETPLPQWVIIKNPTKSAGHLIKQCWDVDHIERHHCVNWNEIILRLNNLGGKLWEFKHLRCLLPTSNVCCNYTKLGNDIVEEKASEVVCTLSVVSLLLTAMVILISLCRASSDVVSNSAICRQILGLVCQRRLLFLGCPCYCFIIVRYGQPVSDLSDCHFCHCLSGLCGEYLTLESKILPSGVANCWPRRHSGHIVHIHNQEVLEDYANLWIETYPRRVWIIKTILCYF